MARHETARQVQSDQLRYCSHQLASLDSASAMEHHVLKDDPLDELDKGHLERLTLRGDVPQAPVFDSQVGFSFRGSEELLIIDLQDGSLVQLGPLVQLY